MTNVTDAAKEAMGTAKQAKAKMMGREGILETLQQEHGEVSAMMKRVLASDDGEVRKELYPKIRSELLAHAKAEEQEFYSVLSDFEETREIARHSDQEHDQVEQLIRVLDQQDINSQQWTNTFQELEQNVTHHVKEEEGTLFPKAQDVLSDEQLQRMNEAYARAKQSAQQTVR